MTQQVAPAHVTGVSRDEVLSWLAQTLKPNNFNDYCPNGLQVEGRRLIKHVVTGVTASQALIDHAIAVNADTILVHHGWFWKGEDGRVTGHRKTRLASLLKHDINLIAYHLPLDAHPTLGNNAQLALKLGLVPLFDDANQPITTGPQSLIWLGHAQASGARLEAAVHSETSANSKVVTQTTNQSLAVFAKHIEVVLRRRPMVIGIPDAPLGLVAWCTGGAQSMFEAAITAGAQTYITGEISEPCAHLARETGVNFICAGHHATERYGIEALGLALASAQDIMVSFVDIDNPA